VYVLDCGQPKVYFSRFLSEPTLEMLADMRSQFARMLADAGLVPPEAAAGSGGGGDVWDDAAASWNRHADSPAVVRRRVTTSLSSM
jgi:hypothetical protein